MDVNNVAQIPGGKLDNGQGPAQATQGPISGHQYPSEGEPHNAACRATLAALSREVQHG